jgi:CHRD domain
MKRRFWLAFSVIPLLAFALVSDVAAGQTDGVKGEGGRPFTTVLSGANEVPAATGSDLMGTAKVTINLGQSELCWDLDYTTATQHVVAAHIHHAAAGTAVSPLIPFFNSAATRADSGCKSVAPAVLADIVAHPADYYVNVHTIEHPSGAGRGQLSK